MTPLHTVEPVGTHWLLRHCDVARSQQRPPHSDAERAQHVSFARHVWVGPHTARPQVVEPVG